MERTSGQEILDVLIVGGGPAGISAAVWCADLGLTCTILEKETELYGQLRWIHNPIANYPGLSARNGEEFIRALAATVERWALRAETGARVDRIDCASRSVVLGDGRTLRGRALFIATGVRRRVLGVPGESEFVGKGILQSGSAERETVKGKRVVVAGGGDAAAENALILAEHAAKVYLVHRRSELAARPEFRDSLASRPNIELVLESRIASIGGDGRVEHVEVVSPSDRRRRIETEFFIARIGVEPNSDLVKTQLATDEKGYILIDHLCRTAAPAVFAIGDVANPVSPTIPTASGNAATAAKAAYALLTARKPV